MEKMGEVLGGADEERSTTCVLLWGEMVGGKGRASSRKMGGWGWKGLVCGCFVGRCWAVGKVVVTDGRRTLKTERIVGGRAKRDDGKTQAGSACERND
ncbi:unnamed protein product [Meloidogyne enterolobii]|uniref:Uncharacterized protein n=1 Tax=Meloidogyne enterolobii TaxID=390850 RepID=A0ACB0YNH3_MELEN